MIPECNYQDGEINPDCDANPRLCMPPTQCDLPGNRVTAECQEEVDCERDENRTHLSCRMVTKCDDPEFALGRDECQVDDPCGNNATMCLTVCDQAEHADNPMCVMQSCLLNPD